MRFRSGFFNCTCHYPCISLCEVNEVGHELIEVECRVCRRKSIDPTRLDATYSYQLPSDSLGRYIIGLRDRLHDRPYPLRLGLPVRHNVSFSISSTSEACRILDLPDEILLQIARHVVPTQMSVHIFPARMASTRGMPVGTSVHTLRLRQPDSLGIDPLEFVDYTALACTCRRFKEVYYSVVYGENHFTIEMATTGLSPRITGSLPENGFESQINCFDHSPETLWPLSSGCAKYLKELTVVISINPKAAHESRLLLRERFQQMLRLFTSDHCLKKVTVDVRKIITPQCYAPFQPPSGRLRWNLREDGVFALDLANSVPVDTDCDMSTTFRESLGELQHVEELLLSAGPDSNVLEDLVGTPKAPIPRKKRRTC